MTQSLCACWRNSPFFKKTFISVKGSFPEDKKWEMSSVETKRRKMLDKWGQSLFRGVLFITECTGVVACCSSVIYICDQPFLMILKSMLDYVVENTITIYGVAVLPWVQWAQLLGCSQSPTILHWNLSSCWVWRTSLCWAGMERYLLGQEMHWQKKITCIISPFNVQFIQPLIKYLFLFCLKKNTKIRQQWIKAPYKCSY